MVDPAGVRLDDMPGGSVVESDGVGQPLPDVLGSALRQHVARQGAVLAEDDLLAALALADLREMLHGEGDLSVGVFTEDEVADAGGDGVRRKPPGGTMSALAERVDEL